MLLDQYLPIAVLVILSTILALLVVVLGAVFGPHRPTKKKSQPYESGMTPYGPGSRRMSVRYYLIAVLFILFDVEVIFFYPWAVVFQSLGMAALSAMFVFIVVLEVAYVYAWKKGALEWE